MSSPIVGIVPGSSPMSASDISALKAASTLTSVSPIFDQGTLQPGGISTIAGAASSAIPIAGAVLSIVTQLFQGHEIRAKDAATENAAMNQIIPYVTQAFLQLVQGMKAGQYTSAQVQTTVSNILTTYNSFVQSLQGKPGVADNGNPPGGVCGKACTAGCCLRGGYVNILAQQILNAISGQPNPNTSNGVWNLGTTGIPADKYGFAGVPGFSVPIIFNASTSVKGVTASVENIFTKFFAFLKGL